MRNVVFVDGARTGFGRMGGSIRQFHTSELLGMAIRALVDKTGIQERAAVDAVYAGSALHDAHTNNIARFASLYAGLPYETSATYIEMQCGSGIACINHAGLSIAAGEIDIAIAGGAESYSQRFAKFSMSVEPYKMIPPTAIPNYLSPVKEDAINMLEISDRMAGIWNVSRTECDEFAVRSQERAARAIAAGYFDEEIFPVTIPVKKGEPIIFDKDEHPRPGTTMEALSKLRTVNPGGVTTAGNASGRNDGAAVVLMMAEETALRLGYTPLARWIGGADCGVDPKIMGIGPAFSNLRLLKRFGLTLDDIDIFECNEAFAAQNISVIREMEKQTGLTIDQSKWNPNGGAIAFGHPNGASGGRIAMFTMKELQRRGGRYGLFSSCCGGGLGVSSLIERV